MRKLLKVLFFTGKLYIELMLDKITTRHSKRFMFALCCLGFSVGLMGCIPQVHKPLPGPCVTSDGTPVENSLILEYIPDPYKASIILEIANLEMLTRMDLYSTQDLLTFLDTVETTLDELTTWEELFYYLDARADTFNKTLKTEIILLSSYFQVLNKPVPLSACDRSLIHAHIERQRRLVQTY